MLVAMPAACWLLIPAGLDFEQAAALPVAYLIAWWVRFGWDRPFRPRTSGAGGGRGRQGGLRLRAAACILRMPARAAMRAAQLFRAEPFTGRVRTMFAAS